MGAHSLLVWLVLVTAALPGSNVHLRAGRSLFIKTTSFHQKMPVQQNQQAEKKKQIFFQDLPHYLLVS